MHRRWIIPCWISALACGDRQLETTAGLPDLPAGVEAISLLGDSLRRAVIADEAREGLESRLEEAAANYEADPEDPDALIWLGRRTAYLGRYREAIELYTAGIREHPEDARMFRHRGHRYISARLLDRAVTDLERGASMVEGAVDEVEPDGLPNALNIPTSTLQTNIWYHLGLAHYLKGNFDEAMRAYEECMDVSNNPDMLVATSYWYYMTLRRLGRDEEAEAVLEPITADMDIIENISYHRLLRLFAGELAVDSLLDTGSETDVPLANATVGYGVGNWHFMNGRTEQAVETWRKVLEGSSWAAFGYIASEAELARP